MKKSGIILIVVIFGILFNVCNANAALGLTPALIEINYEPGMEFSASFSTIGVASGQKINIYAKGDFEKYVTFNKGEMTGPGSFDVKIKLPKDAEKPGKNRLYIGVIENKSAESGIGTAIAVEALIMIHVPYPGKYIELSFSGNDVNVGEPVNFILEINNLGKEDITAEPKIEIYSSDEKIIETLYLESKFVEKQKKETIKKNLDTSQYKPGPYKAIAIVDYGNTADAETDFKIGHLYVDVLNWTSKIKKGKINEFLIGIESKWNSEITNIYAEVNITEDNMQLDNFKTPSVSLKPWEKTTLKGFLNAENIGAGNYRGNLILFYENKTTEKEFDLKVEGYASILVIVGIILLIIIIILIIYKKKKYFINLKHGKKK